MLENYADVIELVRKSTSKLPVWWDCHGAPHYCDPNECLSHKKDLYAFRHIRCQECSRVFWVCLIGPYGHLHNVPFQDGTEYEDDPRWPGHKRERIPNDWYYGDPPFHGGGILGEDDDCAAGYCMSSIPEYEWALKE